MLDVHPPHGKMHGVGDFFLHLFTITVGLLIALGLEGLVEHHHKNELREQAETNLRQEIQANQRDIRKMFPVMNEEQKTLIILLDFIKAREASQPYDIAKLGFGFSGMTLADAAWQTAAATGALALIDYNEVQRYADAYQVQAEVMRLQRVTLDDFLLVESHSVYGFDPTKITPAEALAGEPEVRHTLAHLIATRDYMKGLDEAYSKALGDPAVK